MEKTCRLKAWPMAAAAACVLQRGLGPGARGCMAISDYQAALMLHLRHSRNLQISRMSCNGDNGAKGGQESSHKPCMTCRQQREGTG